LIVQDLSSTFGSTRMPITSTILSAGILAKNPIIGFETLSPISATTYNIENCYLSQQKAKVLETFFF